MVTTINIWLNGFKTRPMKMAVLWSLVIATLATSCRGFDFPFQDPSLPWNERVDDLVGRLTLEEMVPQTMAIYYQETPGIPRLGINPFIWITECLRGEVSTNTTCFPQALGLAASFNTDLLHDVAGAIATEMRAHYNGNRAEKKFVTFNGLSCFGPFINIMRHPLWGRNQEVYGEDPFLTGQLAWAYVKGMQGQHHRYIKAASGCKVVSAYAGPENIPVSRFSFNAKVPIRDWRMTYLPAIKTCVDAGTYSLMCAYNAVNGIPACADGNALTNITRNEWGFKGFVVSDANAINNIRTQHRFTNSSAQTVAVAMKAGCNLELATNGSTVYDSAIDAVKTGLLTEHKLRENIKPLFYTRMKLGEFDPSNMVPYNKIDWTAIQSEEHRELALRAATQTFVLLKHDPDILPIKKMYDRVAIIGPMADNLEQIFGNYASNILKQFSKTPREGLKAIAKATNYASGCNDTLCKNYSKSDIQLAVKGSEIVIVCLGTGQAIEGEGNDRSNIALPGFQLDLLMDAVYYAKGAPIILLLFNAGPLDVTFAIESPSVNAIMACFFPAQSTGGALFAALTASEPWALPAGRLPSTWPMDLEQVPPMTDYNMTGRTYRYFKGTPLFPFGYGLSYSRFNYSDLSMSPSTIEAGGMTQASVTVTNIGSFSCDEVVQVYIEWDNKSLPTPMRQLAGFRRVSLAPDKSATLHFAITSEVMQVWLDDKTGFVVPPGLMHVYAGGQQPNQRRRADSNVLHTTFKINKSRDWKTKMKTTKKSVNGV